ncbi:hypothetical protein ACSMXN_09185 [Jatrophihabitans sp. DSM 45814]
MKTDGYMIDAEFDGQLLTLHAKNKASRAALLGPDTLARIADHYAEMAESDKRIRVEGDSISIPVEDMADVTFKDASMLVNGNLIVKTNDGNKYQAHFRKKQAGGFAELRDAIAKARA